MSEFLFIIPQGWVQIPEETISLIGSLIGDWINMQDMTSLTDALLAYEAIPVGTTVAAAKFFDGEVLAVKLG